MGMIGDSERAVREEERSAIKWRGDKAGDVKRMSRW